jgi:hypothetical protein
MLKWVKGTHMGPFISPYDTPQINSMEQNPGWEADS